MKTRVMKFLTIGVLSFLAIGLMLYAEAGTIYNGNVGNVSSNNPHMLGGNIKVSGVNVPTDLSLNLVLSNGKSITVGTIPVAKDGTYTVAQIIDPIQISIGDVMLNISSSNGLSEKNILVDLSIFEIPNDRETFNTSSSENGFIAKVGTLSSGTASISEATLNNAIATTSPLYNLNSTASLSANSLVLMPEEPAALSNSLTSSTDNVVYNANNMVIKVNSNILERDTEGNILRYLQTATVADVKNSELEELSSIFGSKTLSDWNNFNWNSSITQAALNYLLAVHKGEIKSSINITADNAKTIRQNLLSRMSYGNRSFINGCLSAYDLDFAGINLQNCDWRYRLKDLTPDQLLLSARSIKNAQNFYAGLQGACLPSVSFTGNEDFNGVSLAYVYIGNWTGFSAAQMKQVVKNKGGAVGIFLNEDQYNTWGSIIIGNSSIIFAFGKWNGLGYWEDVFNYMWNENSLDVTADGVVLNNPNQFIICTY